MDERTIKAIADNLSVAKMLEELVREKHQRALEYFPNYIRIPENEKELGIYLRPFTEQESTLVFGIEKKNNEILFICWDDYNGESYNLGLDDFPIEEVTKGLNFMLNYFKQGGNDA